MTQKEKEIILAALSEYAYNRQKESEKAYKKKDYHATVSAHANAVAGMKIFDKIQNWKI